MPQLKPDTTHLRLQTVHGKTFRRFGVEYGPVPKDVPVGDFSAEQIQELMRDCYADGAAGMALRVEQLNMTPPPPPPAKTAKGDPKDPPK